MLARNIKVFADYHQFYVWDSGVAPQAPEDYTDDDVRTMVKTGANVVVVQAIRNTAVPVEIEVHPSDPGFAVADWQHVVECAVELPTGKLQVHECTGGPVLDLDVAPGSYRVRVLFAGLDSLSADALAGDDHYRVVLWPGPSIELRIVHQWRTPAN